MWVTKESAQPPLTDLLGVRAIVARRDAIHEPRRRLALGEVLVGQPGSRAEQLTMGGVERLNDLSRGQPLSSFHESRVPAVEVIVGPARIGCLSSVEPLQRR